MVNTLGSTPEKATSTPNKSGSGMLKKIVAGAIALTLSGQPAEAKTFEKQEFPTEMITNVPGEISPMTENVEQASVPNYINQAQTGVKKYYPQYEEYFKNIFNNIEKGSYEEYIVNKEIKRNLTVSGELLKSDKEIKTMILISLEKIVYNKDNFRDKIGITELNDVNVLSNNVYKAFYRKYLKFGENIKNFEIELNNLKQKISINGINKVGEEYISISEKYMQLFNERLLEYGHLKKSKDLQDWIKTYIEILDKTNRKPNQIGQKYIIEYNKIKN